VVTRVTESDIELLLTSPADGMTRPQRNDWRRNMSSSTDFGLQHYKQYFLQTVRTICTALIAEHGIAVTILLYSILCLSVCL